MELEERWEGVCFLTGSCFCGGIAGCEAFEG